MLKVLLVYGTRPEAIKMAPLYQSLRSDPRFAVKVIFTGQHLDMVQQVHQIFNITPDVDLSISSPGQSLTAITCKVLQRLEPVYRELDPDAVVVQGDTSSALAAGLAAFYAHVPLFHLEAGLRSGDLQNPFPEEANRRLISQLASLHFAPTEANRDALLAEGFTQEKILVTGNTVIDALLYTTSQELSAAEHQASQAKQSRTILVTTHRRENWGAPLQRISLALARIAKDFPEVKIVLPMHKNPAVRSVLQEVLQDIENVELIEPLDYREFARAMHDCYLVLTDSGGVQEEAPSLGKPVLVMRETTERQEGVLAGNVELVGTSVSRIVAATARLLTDSQHYQAVAAVANPYGDGHAATRCKDAILEYFPASRVKPAGKAAPPWHRRQTPIAG